MEANGPMNAGRSLSPPAFNLTSSSPSSGMGGQPLQAKMEAGDTDTGESMFQATQLLKFLNHLDVLIDLKESVTPSLLGIIMKAKKLKGFLSKLSDAKKGASGITRKGVASTGGGFGFAFAAIDLTYWASVLGAKTLARGVYATQELWGSISPEQYENAVENLDDSVPDSLIGFLLSPSKTYQSITKIKRLGKDVIDGFSGLANLKKSLQNGDVSMLDVFKTVSNLKDSIKDLLELCKEVQELLDDWGFKFDLAPVEQAIKKFSAPLRSMKEVINADPDMAKEEEKEQPAGGGEALLKSLEPGYKPLLDSLGF